MTVHCCGRMEELVYSGHVFVQNNLYWAELLSQGKEQTVKVKLLRFCPECGKELLGRTT